MTMINWRARQILKKGKASRTPGKTKGERCCKDATRAYFFTHPHAHRHADYQRWHETAKAWNK